MTYDFCKFNDSKAGKPAELFFYGDIVSDSWGAWNPEDQYPLNVQQLLKDIDGSDIDIHINSGGGDVFAGVAICNMLRSCSGHKTVYIDGLAASIASVIAMAGDEIVIPDNAYMMIHKAWTLAMGNADDMRKLAGDLDKIDGGIVATYMMRAAEGVTEKQIQKLMAAETWLTGAEASNLFSNVRLEQEMAAAVSIGGRFADKYSNVPEALRGKAGTPCGVVPKPAQADVPEDMAGYARCLRVMRAAYEI